MAGMGAIALAVGFWLGTNTTTNGINKLLSKTPKTALDETAEVRKQIEGAWIEEMPVKHGPVPLMGRSVIDFRSDGTYSERTQLLAPDRTPLAGMTWLTQGTWRVSESRLTLNETKVTGPTARVPESTTFYVTAESGELSMSAFGTKERDSDLRNYRRLLAKRLTEEDVESAREETRQDAGDDEGK